MALFHRYYRRRLTFTSNLSISLSPKSVPTRLDRCYHRQFNPKPYIFTIFQVAGWQRSMRRPSLTRMQNGPLFIINRSSPGGGSQEGVLHKCFKIYTPHPKTAPDQGMINRYSPSWETPQRWRARPCPSDPRLGGGGFCVVSWTRMLKHGDSNTPPKTTLYITCGTSSACAAPQKRRLGTSMCCDDAYVKINCMAS